MARLSPCFPAATLTHCSCSGWSRTDSPHPTGTSRSLSGCPTVRGSLLGSPSCSRVQTPTSWRCCTHDTDQKCRFPRWSCNSRLRPVALNTVRRWCTRCAAPATNPLSLGNESPWDLWGQALRVHRGNPRRTPSRDLWVGASAGITHGAVGPLAAHGGTLLTCPGRDIHNFYRNFAAVRRGVAGGFAHLESDDCGTDRAAFAVDGQF